VIGQGPGEETSEKTAGLQHRDNVGRQIGDCNRVVGEAIISVGPS
jgi:hypothetical protein